jgi:PTS system nitrogen regulatory IIA component
MQIEQLISLQRIGFHQALSSKKRALEVLSELFADSFEDIRDVDVFDTLIARERLGTTGFGDGVAIPHGRIPNLPNAAITIIVLETPIDFDSLDSKPVDIIFSLLVPEETTEEHLEILAEIADMLRQPEILQSLRSATSKEAIIATIQQWQASKTW